MALRGSNNGGVIFPLPAGYDDSLDLSLFLWLRRAGTPDAADRVVTLVNSSRTRGLQLTMGGGTLSSAVTDLVLSLGAGSGSSSWGAAASHDGRGRFTTGPLSDTAFKSLAVSVRGPAAADNSGSGGAQQIHQLWFNGVEHAPGATGSGGVAPPNPGGNVSLLMRDAANANYFAGWIAELAVWQDYRLSAADVAALQGGAAALTIAADKLLFYRSLRATTAAEVGDTVLASHGTAPVIEPATHPVVRIAAAGARHDHGAGTVTLAEAAGMPTLLPAAAVLGHHAAAPVLAASVGLIPDAGRHGQIATPVTLAPAALAAPTLAVDPAAHDHRATAAWLLGAAGYGERWRVPDEARLWPIDDA